ncbi:hypothetical protein CQW23_14649 [Capsicum baccatum]|uniref:Ubiquitin-like protease family profile domain-containing protein n=1 Tax=Capsicum baccatum TaxID=33114 RepID=A0A2G2WJT5_CAPBA|nr:hypothetical protein CQW23_14649 [Capsicum baccatum]
MQSENLIKKNVTKKRTYKRKNVVCEQNSDSDFEDEISCSKLKKCKIDKDESSRGTRFLESNLPRNFIATYYFNLVDSDAYLNFDWENECFDVLLKTCSHGLKRNPTSFTFGGFHLALQIWFYECCVNMDKSVAIRDGVHQIPRILNWKTSSELIYNDYLKRTMFKQYSNERELVYVDKSFSNPLKYEIVRNAPQQRADSNDCGLYTCALVEYVSHSVFDVSNINFHAINHRLRYAALLCDFARRKQNDGAISDSEVTGNVTSRFGGPKICNEAVSNIQILHHAK